MKILITGGTGFVGGALARRLHRNGVEVTALGRSRAIGEQLARDGIRFLAANLEDRRAILEACAGQQIVIHSGALASPWGRAQDFYNANVLGTQHVVEGCLAHSVERLLHISTPSVYFFHNSRLNAAESDPLPARFANEYVRTKRRAEEIVSEAVAQRGLFAMTFRPRAIYGAGDRVLLPRVIAALEAKRLPMIGDGTNLGDFTYIDNLVDALVLALSAPADLRGRTFNVTNGEPVPVWSMIDRLCERLNLTKPARRVSFRGAFALATLVEQFYRLRPGMPEPPLTRYTVGVLACSQTLDISAARRDLGYTPAVSNLDGLDQFAKWWSAQHG